MDQPERARRRRWCTHLCVAAAFVSLVSGCAADGLVFRADDRLHFVSPEQRSTVTLPVTIRWTADDIPRVGEASGDAARQFAVFLDRSPQPPGKPMAWIARNDNTCNANAGCPNADYLAARQIYVTSATELTLADLGTAGRAHSGREFHEATIVLLDEDGSRVGEAAFYLEFSLDRP